MNAATLTPQSSPGTASSVFQKLLDFLNKLDEAKLTYRLSHFRDETIGVEIAVPGERWEIEFFANGTVEVERFRSGGDVSADESLLASLFTNYV